MRPSGFSSWNHYFQLTLAREFVAADSLLPVTLPENRLEKLGEAITRPLLTPLNFLVREIKNPLVILAFTVTLVALTTLIFYPCEFMGIIYHVAPWIANVKPWMVKLTVFSGLQTTIFAVGLRALGRMCNQTLLHEWHAGRIIPVHLGATQFLK